MVLSNLILRKFNTRSTLRIIILTDLILLSKETRRAIFIFGVHFLVTIANLAQFINSLILHFLINFLLDIKLEGLKALIFIRFPSGPFLRCDCRRLKSSYCSRSFRHSEIVLVILECLKYFHLGKI